MFLLKIHETIKGSVVAVCDRDLRGSRFSEGERVLEVGEDFFGGNEADVDEIVSALNGCVTANIVGEEIISSLVERNFIDEENISEIDGVPTIQLFYI